MHDLVIIQRHDIEAIREMWRHYSPKNIWGNSLYTYQW